MIKKEGHIVNLLLLFIIGFVFIIIANTGFENTFNYGIAYFLGQLLVYVGPALLFVIIGLIFAIFKKPKWKLFYTLTWIVFILINTVSLIGILMYQNSL